MLRQTSGLISANRYELISIYFDHVTNRTWFVKKCCFVPWDAIDVYFVTVFYLFLPFLHGMCNYLVYKRLFLHNVLLIWVFLLSFYRRCRRWKCL